MKTFFRDIFPKKRTHRQLNSVVFWQRLWLASWTSMVIVLIHSHLVSEGDVDSTTGKASEDVKSPRHSAMTCFREIMETHCGWMSLATCPTFASIFPNQDLISSWPINLPSLEVIRRERGTLRLFATKKPFVLASSTGIKSQTLFFPPEVLSNWTLRIAVQHMLKLWSTPSCVWPGWVGGTWLFGSKCGSGAK